MVWRAACAKDANDPRRTYLASISKNLAGHHAVSNANLAVQGKLDATGMAPGRQNGRFRSI